MGFNGDRTEHVLWRLNHGEVDGISPKLAVVMIGTNNETETAQEVATGIVSICKKIRSKLPHTNILLLGILPRGESSLREKNQKVNQIISRAAEAKMVYYRDIGEVFLTNNGSVSIELMPDYLHPNLKGYKKWADTLDPTLQMLLH